MAKDTMEDAAERVARGQGDTEDAERVAKPTGIKNDGKQDIVSNHRIAVQLIGSGYAALHLVDVTDESGTYTDIQQTGIGRYKTHREAAIEAKMWSESDEIPLVGDD